MLGRQVVLLGAVRLDVVQLPAAGVLADQLPSARTARPGCPRAPRRGRRSRRRSRRTPAPGSCPPRAGPRRAPARRVLRPGDVDAGRHEVDEVAGRRCRAPLSAVRPPGQWAMSGVLMPPSWTQCLYSRNGVLLTRSPSPGRRTGRSSCGGPGITRPGTLPGARPASPSRADSRSGSTAVPRWVAVELLGAAAVVRQEQDQRVVELAGPLQPRHDLADRPGPSGRPSPRRPPCRAASHSFGRWRSQSGDAGVARRQLGASRRCPQLGFLRSNRAAAQLRSRRRTCPLYFAMSSARRVHRPVRGGVGDVQEERLVGLVAWCSPTNRDGVVGDRVGVVEASPVLGGRASAYGSSRTSVAAGRSSCRPPWIVP